MPFVPFQDFYPEFAQREVRTATLPEGDEELPADTYVMFEVLRRAGLRLPTVYFRVVSERYHKQLAVVSYGWESLDFYVRWLKGTPVNPRLLQGPILDLVQPPVEIRPDAAALDRRGHSCRSGLHRAFEASLSHVPRRGRRQGPARRLRYRIGGWRPPLQRLLFAKMQELQERRSQKKKRAA